MSETEAEPVPTLHCYYEYDDSPALVPGRSERAWMDKTSQRFAYRCTPLAIANASGWELQAPVGFSAHWTGGDLKEDLLITPDDPGNSRASRLAVSAFGHGVLTFHPGYLFRTSPGWALWTRGAPNTVKDGIAPLDGLVETAWLPFTFTMNWKFTRPGSIRFDAGERFAFLMMTPHRLLDRIQPVLAHLDTEPGLKAASKSWAQSRIDFNDRLAAHEPQAVKEGWQRNYVQGKDPTGYATPDYHLTKRKLNAPVEIRGCPVHVASGPPAPSVAQPAAKRGRNR